MAVPSLARKDPHCNFRDLCTEQRYVMVGVLGRQALTRQSCFSGLQFTRCLRSLEVRSPLRFVALSNTQLPHSVFASRTPKQGTRTVKSSTHIHASRQRAPASRATRNWVAVLESDTELALHRQVLDFADFPQKYGQGSRRNDVFSRG